MEVALKFIHLSGQDSLKRPEKQMATELYDERRRKLESYWEEPIDENHSGFDPYKCEMIAQGEDEWDATCEFEQLEEIIGSFCKRYTDENQHNEDCDKEAALIRKRLYMGYFLFKEDAYKVNHRIGKQTGKRLSKYEQKSREARTVLKNCAKIRIHCAGGEIKQCSIHRKNRSKVIIDELYLGLMAVAIQESSISNQITISEGEISYTPSNTVIWEPLKSIINELLKKYSVQVTPVSDFADAIYYLYLYIMEAAPKPWTTNMAVKFIINLFNLQVKEETLMGYIGREHK